MYERYTDNLAQHHSDFVPMKNEVPDLYLEISVEVADLCSIRLEAFLDLMMR